MALSVNFKHNGKNYMVKIKKKKKLINNKN